MQTYRHAERFSEQIGEVLADLWIFPNGKQVDLSGVHIVHQGVDTIRQLYSGNIRIPTLREVEAHYDAGFHEHYEFLGKRFAVRSGGQSGFDYRLQSNEAGIIIFLKSTYAKEDKPGTHLKIELSPHFINVRTYDEIQATLNDIAGHFLKNAKTHGCAFHLCVDVQGWQLERDTVRRIVTRARKIRAFDTIEELTFDMRNVAAIYGEAQSLTLGSASGLQLCIYDKTAQAADTDKLDYWESQWSQFPDYKQDQRVTRIELRFHHSVVQDFARGSKLAFVDIETGEYHAQEARELNGFIGCAPHFKAFWQYALEKSYRLEDHRGWVDAFWSKLIQDAEWHEYRPAGEYKRVRKTPGRGNEKNIQLAVGNLLSLYARNSFTARMAWEALKKSGVWNEIQGYYFRRGMTEGDLFQHISQQLTLRRLLGRAA
jgi:hypothetical protein